MTRKFTNTDFVMQSTATRRSNWRAETRAEEGRRFASRCWRSKSRPVIRQAWSPGDDVVRAERFEVNCDREVATDGVREVS